VRSRAFTHAYTSALFVIIALCLYLYAPACLSRQVLPKAFNDSIAHPPAIDPTPPVADRTVGIMALNSSGGAASVARVYADVNANMPRAYWDYDSVNISWGVLENYEVVRKIGAYCNARSFSFRVD
jgi:casein kinase II subunit alpha